MVAFMCRWYSLNIIDCMKLPIRTFFALHEEAIKMQAREFKELLLIQKVTVCSNEYFEFLHNRYMGMIYKEAKELPKKPPEPNMEQSATSPGAFVVESGSNEAQSLFIHYSNRLRQAKGYV